MTDSGLRVGCAGPNARSMSLAVLPLFAAGATALRRHSSPQPVLRVTSTPAAGR